MRVHTDTGELLFNTYLPCDSRVIFATLEAGIAVPVFLIANPLLFPEPATLKDVDAQPGEPAAAVATIPDENESIEASHVHSEVFEALSALIMIFLPIHPPSPTVALVVTVVESKTVIVSRLKTVPLNVFPGVTMMSVSQPTAVLTPCPYSTLDPPFSVIEAANVEPRKPSAARVATITNLLLRLRFEDPLEPSNDKISIFNSFSVSFI